ncbi:MAG: ABC transporter ATP-binding protein [Erysipelotrichaceae bacterium]|nr:ABC transporter ATP-binding protein [Erysipelotrichaceae bacterium]
MSNILIEANNISKVYDPDIFLKRGHNNYALKNVNFILNEGDFISIMGPSGSGKSTLLNCLSTLDTVSSGNIKFMDKVVSYKSQSEFRSKYLGFVFQNHNLISYLSIFDNIATPAMLTEVKGEDLINEVKRLAKQLDIEHLLDKFPNECSGGECQRAAIARALINHPKILCCDEPTGNLDSHNSHKILSILSELNKQGTSIILITHDAMIASYANQMMYLYDGCIKTVVNKGNDSQIDFYKKISSVTMQDSLLKEIDKNAIDTVENTTNVTQFENDIYDYTGRTHVYIRIKDKPYNKKEAEKVNEFVINETSIDFVNLYNNLLTINIKDIQTINLNLEAKLGMLGTFNFNILMDITCHDRIYQFLVINDNDFVDMMNYLKQLDIEIIDERHIIEIYQQYPDAFERQKHLQYSQKDLMKYKGK